MTRRPAPHRCPFSATNPTRAGESQPVPDGSQDHSQTYPDTRKVRADGTSPAQRTGNQNGPRQGARSLADLPGNSQGSGGRDKSCPIQSSLADADALSRDTQVGPLTVNAARLPAMPAEQPSC